VNLEKFRNRNVERRRQSCQIIEADISFLPLNPTKIISVNVSKVSEPLLTKSPFLPQSSYVLSKQCSRFRRWFPFHDCHHAEYTL